MLTSHKHHKKTNKKKSKTPDVDNQQLETMIKEQEKTNTNNKQQLPTHNTPVDNNVINTDYTNNSITIHGQVYQQNGPHLLPQILQLTHPLFSSIY